MGLGTAQLAVHEEGEVLGEAGILVDDLLEGLKRRTNQNNTRKRSGLEHSKCCSLECGDHQHLLELDQKPVLGN